MRPTLSYGRHRGPARLGCRKAAVALSLFQDQCGQWVIPLTRRPMTLSHHGGQICLPGGRIEANEPPIDAALREFEEELGVRATVIEYCGELRQQYVYASDNAVHALVFLIEPPQVPWAPDPAEVDEVLLLPIASLLDPKSRALMKMSKLVRFWAGPRTDRIEFWVPTIHWKEHTIWGATAMILDELAQILL